MLDHLMEPNQFTGQARRAARCGASGKCRNAAGGLIWPTEGRVFASAGRRYGPLVVTQTTAWTVPGQQTRKPGQMIQHKQTPL